MDAIVFDAMSYAYPQGDVVLKDIKLTIPQGSFAVLTGAEGTGKTTLCLAIAGAVPGYFGGRMAGDVRVGSVKTTETTVADLAHKVGLVLGDYDSQLVALTVAEEVAFGLENRGVAAEEIPEKVSNALSLVGLRGKENLETANLSGGQRQRLAIASMLATEPEILVLDEPASALDPEGSADLYRLLGELNQPHGKTVVVVEHNLANVLAYADQLLVVDKGRLKIAGPPAEVLTAMVEQGIYAEAVSLDLCRELKISEVGEKEVAKIA